MTQEGIVQLINHKTLILGNKVIEESYKPKPQDIAKLGLFDSSAPNYVAYDPSVSTSDFNPKEEDYIYPKFRLLSETIVHPQVMPIDFSDSGVLKKSMDLLSGTAIYPDHEPSVGNSFGVIQSLEWEEAYEVEGLKVPAGINAVLKLDAKANPRIARLLLMTPPAINSTSVTVQFQWKKSHNISDDEFWSKLGSYDKDGQMYRRIVTGILSYPEVSLVTMGADKFAQKISDKGIVNPHKAKARLSDVTFSVNDYSKLGIETKSFSFNNNKQTMDPFERLSTLLSGQGVSLSEINWEEAKDEDILKLFEPIKGTQLPEAFVKLHEAMPDLDLDQVTKLQENQVTDEQSAILSEIPDKETLEKFKANSAYGESYIQSLRSKTIGNYKLTAGKDQESPAVIKLLESADEEALTELNKGYELSLNALSPLTCQDCGSTTVERKAKEKVDTEKNSSDVESSIRKSKSRKPSDIHKGKEA